MLFQIQPSQSANKSLRAESIWSFHFKKKGDFFDEIHAVLRDWMVAIFLRPRLDDCHDQRHLLFINYDGQFAFRAREFFHLMRLIVIFHITGCISSEKDLTDRPDFPVLGIISRTSLNRKISLVPMRKINLSQKKERVRQNRRWRTETENNHQMIVRVCGA